MEPLTTKLVKQLRDDTGASLMDCKRALTDTDRDYELAKQLILGKFDPDDLDSTDPEG